MMTVLKIWIMVIAAFVSVSLSNAETVVAGWDNSFNIGGGVPQAADHAASGIIASVFWSGQNPARGDKGSGDLTFGTFTGAVESVDLVTGSEVIYETTVLEFSITNAGSASFDLSSFHFDAWRAYGGNAPSIQVSVLAGSGISTGLVGISETLPVQNGAPVTGSDYTDVDLPLTGLADYTLEPGESAVFRLETTSDAIYVDNFAVTGDEIPSSSEELVAGWDNSFVIGGGVPQAADHAASGITATVFWSGENPARGDKGSGDLTFGTFTGAVESVDLVTGSEVIYETTVLEFTITNTGPSSYDLYSFRFDAWRSYGGNAPSIQVSVLAGSGISTGLVGISETLPVQYANPSTGSDYTDVDLWLAGLADHTLDVGESAVFRLETTSGAIYVDNFAVTGDEDLPPPEELAAGWDNSFVVDGGASQAADHVAIGIAATVFWSGETPARGDKGSGDLTFGTFTGAVESVDLETGSQVIYETTVLDFAVTNTGIRTVELSSFRFDAWRSYVSAAPSLQLSVLAGSGISTGLVGVSETLPVQAANPVTGSDYTDIDLWLNGLADHTLEPGEGAVFRLETTSSAIYVDNFAVLKFQDVIAPGYEGWSTGWGVDIGSETNDYDMDGLSNLAEYGLDGDPTSASSTGTKPSFTATDSGTFEYVYPKRTDDDSLVYTMETTQDLIDGIWTNTGYITYGTNVTGGTLNFITNSIDTADDQTFIRLLIDRP